MKAICLVTIGLMGAALSPMPILAETPASATPVAIRGLPTATKGFPYILKITIYGPGSIPYVTLLDDTLPFRVTFSAVGSGRTYSLSSSKEADTVIITPEGDRLKDGQDMWQMHVERGKQQSILIDLASIRPEIGRGMLFDDLAPGEYDVTVSLSGDNAPSNTLRVNVTAPDVAEQQFLAEVLQQGPFCLGKGVNWSKALRNRIRLQNDKWDRLNSTTKEQIAFHRLLAELNVPDKILGPDDEGKVKTTPLPKFLEPEREYLLHEVAITVSGKRDEAEAARLMEQYPDLEWRLQDLQTGMKGFIRFKKPAANKGE